MAVMSHEIRTHINTIDFYSQELIEICNKKILLKKVKNNSKMIKNTNSFSSFLVDEFIDFNRI